MDETPEDVFYRYGYYGLRNVVVVVAATFGILLILGALGLLPNG